MIITDFSPLSLLSSFLKRFSLIRVNPCNPWISRCHLWMGPCHPWTHDGPALVAASLRCADLCPITLTGLMCQRILANGAGV